MIIKLLALQHLFSKEVFQMYASESLSSSKILFMAIL